MGPWRRSKGGRFDVLYKERNIRKKPLCKLNLPLKSSSPPDISTSSSPSLSHSFPILLFLIFGLVATGDPENNTHGYTSHSALDVLQQLPMLLVQPLASMVSTMRRGIGAKALGI